MSNKRPVNLNLMAMRFPVTAITSILHRVTGVLMFLFLPFLLSALGASLANESSFQAMQVCLSTPLMRFFSFIIINVIGYHVLAGFRHIIMDMGILPVSLKAGRISSWAVLLLTALFAVYVGVYLW